MCDDLQNVWTVENQPETSDWWLSRAETSLISNDEPKLEWQGQEKKLQLSCNKFKFLIDF